MSIGSRLEFVSSNTMVLRNTDQTSVARRSLDARDVTDARNPSTPWAIDQSSFEELLRWLDPDPEIAGGKYEVIRHKLMTMFKYRGCDNADDLADETFDRVARRLPQVEPSYVGDPVRYFYGVARNVCMEYLRSLSHKNPPIFPAVKDDQEDLLQRLDLALCRLSMEDRELILEYYRDDGRSKIVHRKALAQQTGLRPEALRTRTFRIRSQLREYLDAGNCGSSSPSFPDNGLADKKNGTSVSQAGYTRANNRQCATPSGERRGSEVMQSHHAADTLVAGD